MSIKTPSLCIPRVFPNIDEHRIREIFDELKMGEIERIDIVKKQTEKGEKFNRVFIHWKYWSTGGNADISRERLLNGKEIKIIYDDPWFWKVSAYKMHQEIPNLRTNTAYTRQNNKLYRSQTSQYTDDFYNAKIYEKPKPHVYKLDYGNPPPLKKHNFTPLHIQRCRPIGSAFEM